MWTQTRETCLNLHRHAMTEFEAAAEAWDIGDAFAGDAFSDDGNSLSPSDGPCPTHVGGKSSRGPVAWEARERTLKRVIARLVPVAMAVAPASPARGLVAAPGLAAITVATSSRA